MPVPPAGTGKGDQMEKFYVAGCFADSIIVDRDQDRIEKKEGGPAYFIKNVLEDLGEGYSLAKAKKGIIEVHIQGGKEVGRFPRTSSISTSTPITSPIILAYSISGEICLDRLKGNFEEIYADSRGFVRDPENFGKKREWKLNSFEKIKVLKTTPAEMEYLPAPLLSHIRKNGVLVVMKDEGKVEVVEQGETKEYSLGDFPASESFGMREVFFAAFSSEYSRSRNAGKAAEFAIEYSLKYLAGKDENEEG